LSIASGDIDSYFKRFQPPGKFLGFIGGGARLLLNHPLDGCRSFALCEKWVKSGSLLAFFQSRIKTVSCLCENLPGFFGGGAVDKAKVLLLLPLQLSGYTLCLFSIHQFLVFSES
jgi:hypothetical protein